MTSPPNLRHAARRILERALPAGSTEGVLSDIFALLAGMDDIEWSKQDKGLTLAQRAVRSAASGDSDRPAIRQAQELLCDLLARAGQDLSPQGPIMSDALAHAAPWFVLRAQVHAPFTPEQVESLRQWFPPYEIKTATRLRHAWKNHPVLSGLATSWEDEIRQSAWLQPGVSAYKLRELLPGFKWTPQDARRYLTRRVWPDWIARRSSQDLPESMSMAGSYNLSSDNKNLYDCLGLYEVIQLAFTGPNAHKPENSVGFLPALVRAIGWNNKLDWSGAFKVPIPRGWLIDEINYLRKVGPPDEQKFVQNYWRALAYAQIDQGIQKFDWTDMMLGEEILGQINHNYTPSRRLIAGLTEYMRQNPGPPPAWPTGTSFALPHTVVLSAWVAAAPPEQWKRRLPDWGASHVSLDLLGKKQTAQRCHGRLAQAVLLRILRAADEPEDWKDNYSVFWSHFLRADAASLPSLLKQLGNTGAPDRPDPFDVTVGDPVILDALSHMDQLPTFKDPRLSSEFRRVVLDLRSRVSAIRNPSPRQRM